MNIKDAKEQIKNAMSAYFAKNEFGEYIIPIEKQRPIFLIGAPGIGKTAIMEQVAAELGVGLVSYSMTHHTRQSALGLPYIEKKTYAGKEYSVSEYTMSEIIASVYDMIEEAGAKEGILFLDEINCVSETLAPSMLQFLQYKIFGRHRVPDGWIVVTAGNPPEYNNSVREFDIVTWDRLKRIDVEPDFEVWKEYAINRGTHPSIISYLEVRKDDFYKIESTVGGKSFVTARGWSDLSDMIKLYEEQGIAVDKKLVSQYVQNPEIAKKFSIYYDLFNKYRSDYQIDRILDGTAGDDIYDRAKKAKFDERLAFVSLLLDGVFTLTASIALKSSVQKGLLESVKNIRLTSPASADDWINRIAELNKQSRSLLETARRSSSMSRDKQTAMLGKISALDDVAKAILEGDRAEDPYKYIKKYYDAKLASLKKEIEKTKKSLANAFNFLEKVFGDGQEILVFVTELTLSQNTAQFISKNGCDEYYAHNKQLLFYERQKEIISEIERLTLDED